MQLTDQLVALANAEENFINTVDVDLTKDNDGKEIAELESKIKQFEKEMREEISSVSVATAHDFK